MDQLFLKYTFVMTFLVLSLLTRISTADEYISPPAIDGSTVINAEQLIQLAQETDGLIIVDSRMPSDRRQGYIPDSINLPDTETDCSSLFHLIYRKNTPVIFYCNGPKCQRSDRAVVIARDCGYTNIYWFRGGFEEWMTKQYVIYK